MAKANGLRNLADFRGRLVTFNHVIASRFFGEAISHLSGQIGHFGIAYPTRVRFAVFAKNAPRNDIPNGFDAGLSSYAVCANSRLFSPSLTPQE
jgi:hypothetical protein